MCLQEPVGWTFGYVRVSSADQNEARQLAVMDDIDPDNIIIEKESGKDRSREKLEQLLKTVRRGDTVRVKSPDRLARNTIDLLNIAHELHDKGVNLEFADAPMLNVNSAQGEFMLTIYGGFAQFERAMIRERQAEGIAIAKAAGKYKREASLTPEQVARARSRLAIGVSKSQVARELGVSRPTLYDALDGKGIYGGEEYGKVPGPRVVDLFCGCGGMSLGFGRAGYEVVAAVDNWKPALDVYRSNLKAPVLEFDLSDTDAAVSVLAPLAPDVIIEGPPCQDFSIAGNRDEDGGRAELPLAYADVVARLRPKAFVMENVPTAMQSDTYAEAFSRLREAGYGITTAVLDASRCGVPQARERCFTVGILGESDGVLAEELESHLAERRMTVRDYMGDALGTEFYFCMPRSYKRRGIFSVDEPAATIRGMNRPMPATYKRHPGDVADPSEARVLTEDERGYLQTFPKWFEWSGSKADVNQMIGNAVPINMARYVAEVLKARLNGVDVIGLTTPTFEVDAEAR